MNNRLRNKLRLPVIDCQNHKRNCLLHNENFMKLTILRSSRISSSKHRINLYFEKIDEIKSGNKILKPEVS